MSRNKQSVVAKPAKMLGFRVFEAIGKFSVRFRWLVLIVWLVGSVLIVKNLPSLSSVTQSNNSSFLPASAPSEKAAQLASVFGHSNLQGIPVIISRDNGPLTTSDQTSIVAIENSLRHVDNVKQVTDQGRSPDNQADELIAFVSNQNMDPTTVVDNLRSAFGKIALPSGLHVHLAGDVATSVDNAKSSGSTNSQLEMFSALFIIVLLVLIFRAPLAPLITLFPPLMVVMIAGPLIAEASTAGLKVSSLAQLLLTVLVLGAGTDYGLFLIFRVKEELRAGLSGREAVVQALSRVGETISFSAATVIAALLSLTFASFEIYSDLGTPLAIGIALMLLAGLTLLPALIAIFGRAVFWPSNVHKPPKKSGLWGRIASKVVKKPLPTLVTGIVVFAVLAFSINGYYSSGFGGTTTSPSGSDSALGNAELAAHFPKATANPTEVIFKLATPVWDNPTPAVVAQQRLSNSTVFSHVTGPLDPNGLKLSGSVYTALYKTLGPATSLPAVPKNKLPVPIPIAVYQAYRATADHVSSDGRTLLYLTSLKVGDPGTAAALQATPSMRSTVAAIGSSIGAQDYGVTGEAPALYDISNISNQDLKKIIPIAIIIIGVILAILMRSLVAPIYLIISVVLSYLAALGLSVLVFIRLSGDNGIVFLMPFLMFIFLLALGEDYNILVMTRIREEAHGLPLKEAVTKALTTTGTTVTSAGLVLAGTFVILAVVGGRSGGTEIQEIGYGLALGILMDTFLVRTLLVPATVILLGRWNWWPSKHGRWIDQG